MSDKVMIHVRFAPDAQVTEIGERPDGVPGQVWFDYLHNLNSANNSFQTLSGGRGVFTLSREAVEAAKAALVSKAGA